MTTRTTEIIVQFSSPFVLPGFDGPQPPGEYRVAHDEEAIDGVSWVAWRRVGSFIELPGIGMTAAIRQVVPIALPDLDAALQRDRDDGRGDVG
ncbi:MAG: hypothetical protein AB7P02_23590 [Alphaproteobacteria bacterium]